MAELSKRFAEMQEKLDKPSCFGKWNKSVKCGSCWFWPKCYDGKTTAKKAKPAKQKDQGSLDLESK